MHDTGVRSRESGVRVLSSRNSRRMSETTPTSRAARKRPRRRSGNRNCEEVELDAGKKTVDTNRSVINNNNLSAETFVHRRPLMQVHFQIFRSTTKPWEQLFGDAAKFATTIGLERLICISHSHESSIGVVTVWYWGAS